MPDSDFLLEPDDIESPDRPERKSPPRYVPLGGPLHPTEPVPSTGRKGPAPLVCFEPCSCGSLILWGATDAGSALALNPRTPSYVVYWTPQAVRPRLVASAAYPLHRCRG